MGDQIFQVAMINWYSWQWGLSIIYNDGKSYHIITPGFAFSIVFKKVYSIVHFSAIMGMSPGPWAC